jgi:hypothetical protein
VPVAGARRQAHPQVGHLPRWLAGDWGRLVRDPIDLLRAALLVGAFATLVVGPREQSFRLLLTFVVTLTPRALDVPRPFDLAFVTALSFQAWGNVFGAFDQIYGYDKVVHFALPAATSAMLYLALVRFRVVPELATEKGIHERAGIMLVTFTLGITLGGGLYEIYEWFANHYLGAHLYVSYGDSIGDLIDDAIGSLCGGALILVWDEVGWGTRRRRPGRRSGPGQRDPVVEVGDRIVEKAAPSADLRPHHVAPRLPKWLAGDWSRTVRDPIDLLRIAIGAAAVVALAGGDYSLAVRIALSFLAAVMVRAIDAPRLFDLAFTVAMGAQSWGALANANASVSGYETAMHVVVSAALAPTLYIALVRLRLVPDLSTQKRLHETAAIALIGFAAGFSAGILYEISVFVGDQIAGGGDVTYPLLIRRLALDALGALGGAALLVLWDRRGWPSRRVPGARLVEGAAA